MIHQVCVIIHTVKIYFPQSINSLPWRGMAVGFALRTRAICRLSSFPLLYEIRHLCTLPALPTG